MHSLYDYIFDCYKRQHAEISSNWYLHWFALPGEKQKEHPVSFEFTTNVIIYS